MQRKDQQLTVIKDSAFVFLHNPESWSWSTVRRSNVCLNIHLREISGSGIVNHFFLPSTTFT